MKFKLFGTEIYVSFLFLAAVTAMLYCDKTGLFLPTIFAVFLHELGHLFMMWKTECAPKKIRLIPASVQIVNSATKGYKNDALIALSGPLASFIAFAVFYVLFCLFKSPFLAEFSAINLALFLFNLLPLKGLDGGVILAAFLCRKFDIVKAERALKFITVLFSFCVILAAFLSVYFGKTNPSLFIFGVYLVFYSALKA